MASDITRWLEGLVIRLRRWATLLWREIRMPARPVLRAVNLWLDADGLRMSAAMSFYGILSLAPLVALLVSVLGRWLDMERLEANLMGRISAGLGQQAADVVQQSLGNAFTSDGTAASLLTFLVFASGALGVFAELLFAFERLWRFGRPDMPALPWWNSVLLHLRSTLYILVMGVLLVVSLVASTVMTLLVGRVEAFVALGPMLPLLNELVAFVACTLLFIGLMRMSTGPKPALRHMAWGAVVGAVLFSLVRHALTRYLTSAPIVNAYGAAGSMVAVLMWFYITSAILLFAAAWARALADESRLRRAERELAEQATAKARALLPSPQPSPRGRGRNTVISLQTRVRRRSRRGSTCCPLQSPGAPGWPSGPSAARGCRTSWRGLPAGRAGAGPGRR